MAHHNNDSHTGTQLSKRRALRTPLIVQKVKIELDKKVFFGYSKNISKSGMFIASVNPLDPGTQVEVEIPLPSDPQKTIRCRCEVIWKRLFAKKSIYEPGMGLKFLDLPEAMELELDSWASQDS